MQGRTIPDPGAFRGQYRCDSCSVGQEYLTEKEAKAVRELFQKCLKSYEEKSADISDKEWLAQLLRNELPNMSDDEIELRKYLQRVADNTEFKAWYFGHFHDDMEVEDMFYCLYDDIVVL